jgi:hypothetical protein
MIMCNCSFRIILAQIGLLESNNTSIINSIRLTSSSDVCIQGNLCENHAICQEQSDGSYKCLCAFGWKGRYCNESKFYLNK